MQAFSWILFLVSTAMPWQAGARHEVKAIDWQQVHGSVELSPQDALVDAERVAARAVWNRFSEVWKSEAGLLVPSIELERKALPWIRQKLSRTSAVKSLPIEVFESSVGKAYRKSFKIQLDGMGARKLRRGGSLLAAELGSRYRKHYFAIAMLWVFLIWLSRRLDLSTRGYLTTRIRLMSAVAGILGAVLLMPF